MAKDKNKIKLKSEEVKKRERGIKVLKLALLLCLLFLVTIYFILRLMYTNGAFTVSLDQNFAKKTGIILFENLETMESKRVLEAEKPEFMDNISINWLPSNINDRAEGSHNGENFIAYTFYIHNQGSSTIHYWYAILIDDVIRNVDEAIRVMIYQNGERTVYAKQSPGGGAENGTTPFHSEEFVMLEQRREFREGETDKYTIVIWVEGDDPQCKDPLIGGEMKMHMEITEEHFLEKGE